MKKLKYLLLLLLLLIPITSKAAVYHCSVSSGTVVSGQNFTVRFYGNLSSSSTTWSGTIYSEGNARYVSGGTGIWHDGASFSQTVTYTATNPGTAKFYVGNIDVSDENQEYSGSDTCSVTVVAANSSNTSSSRVQANVSQNKKNNDSKKSSDNALKKLEVEGVTLDPEFGTDTLEYTASVEGTKDKINIITETNDSKANVDGDGERELLEGFNEIVITVYAENGDAREYKLKITREELNPIEITINGKKYRVVKKETDLEIPDGYEKETIIIDEEEVVAYSNKKNTLVVLVDENGNRNFFIYDKKNDTYTKFIQLISEGIRLTIKDAKSNKVPYGYKKVTFSIDGEKVDGYCYNSKDKFRLVYAVNENDGDEGFYLYDMEQKTFQRFYDTQVKEYLVYLRYIMYGVAGAALIIIILFGSVISLSSKNRKLKKGNKELPKKEVVKEEPKKEVKPDTKKLSEKEMDEILSRTSIREGRRLQKEAERKQKEEAKDFLK